MKKKKVVLHLCAGIGADSRYFHLDSDYEVIRVGKEIGVENFSYEGEVHMVIANPPCTEFSTASYDKPDRNLEEGMLLVNHCLRIIEECSPKYWCIENPSRGLLKKFLGKPDHVYQPWQFGSSYTKATGLWGNFNMPEPTVKHRKDVVINPDLYIRPRDTLPSLALLHKSAMMYLPEFAWAKDRIHCDADLRSLCSDGFARALYEANK